MPDSSPSSEMVDFILEPLTVRHTLSGQDYADVREALTLVLGGSHRQQRETQPDVNPNRSSEVERAHKVLGALLHSNVDNDPNACPEGFHLAHELGLMRPGLSGGTTAAGKAVLTALGVSRRERGLVVNGQRLSFDPTWWQAAVERARDALQLKVAEHAMKRIDDWNALAEAALVAALRERP